MLTEPGEATQNSLKMDRKSPLCKEGAEDRDGRRLNFMREKELYLQIAAGTTILGHQKSLEYWLYIEKKFIKSNRT